MGDQQMVAGILARRLIPLWPKRSAWITAGVVCFAALCAGDCGLLALSMLMTPHIPHLRLVGELLMLAGPLLWLTSLKERPLSLRIAADDLWAVGDDMDSESLCRLADAAINLADLAVLLPRSPDRRLARQLCDEALQIVERARADAEAWAAARDMRQELASGEPMHEQIGRRIRELSHRLTGQARAVTALQIAALGLYTAAPNASESACDALALARSISEVYAADKERAADKSRSGTGRTGAGKRDRRPRAKRTAPRSG